MERAHFRRRVARCRSLLPATSLRSHAQIAPTRFQLIAVRIFGRTGRAIHHRRLLSHLRRRHIECTYRAGRLVVAIPLLQSADAGGHNFAKVLSHEEREAPRRTADSVQPWPFASSGPIQSNGHPGRMSFVFRYPKQRIWLAGLAMFTISQFFNFFAVGLAPQGKPLALSYHERERTYQHAHAQKHPTSRPRTCIQAPNGLTSQRSFVVPEWPHCQRLACRDCCATRRGHAGCQHLQRVVLPQRELRQVLRCSRSVSAAPRHAISPCRSPVLRCADGRSSERRRSSRAARSWFASRTKRRGLARLAICSLGCQSRNSKSTRFASC